MAPCFGRACSCVSALLCVPTGLLLADLTRLPKASFLSTIDTVARRVESPAAPTCQLLDGHVSLSNLYLSTSPPEPCQAGETKVGFTSDCSTCFAPRERLPACGSLQLPQPAPAALCSTPAAGEALSGAAWLRGARASCREKWTAATRPPSWLQIGKSCPTLKSKIGVPLH